MLSITEYRVEKTSRDHFIIITPDAKYLSSGGMVWWKMSNNDMVEVIPREDEQYLSKLLQGHCVLEWITNE